MAGSVRRATGIQKASNPFDDSPLLLGPSDLIEDTLIVLDDFNSTTGTDSDGYESCGGSYISGSRDESSSVLLDLAKTRRLKIPGS